MHENLRYDLKWRILNHRHDTQLWALEYDCALYLKDISDDQLDRRYFEVYKNIDYLVCELRDVPPVKAHFVSSWWWLKVKFHTECEYIRRNRTLPIFNLQPPAPNWKVPYAPSHPNDSKFIVKYGEALWLEPMLKEGKFRIHPASKYSEVPETDLARYDDELNMHRYYSSKGTTLKLLRTGEKIPICGNLQQTTGGSNYYVFCCSNELDYRLFREFTNETGQPANSCLVIHDVAEFAKRIDNAVRTRLSVRHFYDGIVVYYDPFNVSPYHRTSPGVSKHFKYAYQREYRFVWHLPVSHKKTLEYFDLKVGSLEDIAELHHY